MTHELVPDLPCPYCEKQNTTHRRALQEDGFTKVSRRCTSCGNEWTHTWDRDWLADAKIKRLSAENIELRAEVERLRQEDTRTRHALKGWVWVCPDGGDEPTHERVSAVVSEVEKQRAERERLREETEQLRDILRCVSVHLNRDGTVNISFVSEGCTVSFPIRPQTTWALEVLIEFDQARRKALEGNL